jgi:plastocyanin
LRRRIITWASLALALSGLTCRDAPTGIAGVGSAALDFSAFALQAPGDPPVPVDSIEVRFLRTDQTVAAAETLALASYAQGDSFVVQIEVTLDQTPQLFDVTVRVFGGGFDWYTGTAPVQLASGATTNAAIPVLYVGPGATADSVRIQFASAARFIGGTAAPVTATVYDNNTPVTGVPVGYLVGNGAVATLSGQTLTQATLTAQTPVRDSTWVYAETPTHLRDSIRVRVVPPPAQLVTVSGGGQSGPPGQPLAAPFVVRVLDALNAGYAGDTVNWAVTAGTAALSAAATFTDSAGYASVTATPSGLGTVTVQASAPGLTGSPQAFSATVVGASGIAIVSGNGQTDTINATLQPFVVLVTDALSNPVVGTNVSWTRFFGNGSISASLTTTDNAGRTQITYTLGGVPGTDSVRATLVSSGANVVFGAATAPGSVASVTIDRTLDTIPKAGTLQYNATLRDAQGNVIAGTVTWSSTAPTIASVNASGLATALAGGLARIVAASGGKADTADLWVRALTTVAVAPADTVITAVGDSFVVRAAALDNFGDTVTTGIGLKFISASPSIATVNPLTGRVNITGPGNGVLLGRDTVSGTQGAGTVRVNQIVQAVSNTPADSIQVGVGGRGQIVGRALDRNNYPIPGKTLSWASRATGVATVDQAGAVTGVALGQTWVVDSLVDSAGVFKDSTLVSVVSLPPPVIQWAYDSVAVGNGGNLSVALTLTRPNTTGPLIVKFSWPNPAVDSFIAKPSVRAVTFPANVAATSVTINGLSAGRVLLIAEDSSGFGYAADTMVVTVVSTIEFREIGSFSRQQYFYVNNNQTHRAQVFLSDPAPAGGLGVTFEFGSPGVAALSPSPAIIPAGQLSADVTIQGIGAGRDSVIPTSGGFVGRFSYVYVAPESLQLQLPYPYNGVLGVGQWFQPYVYFTYSMDHPQIVNVELVPAIGTKPDTVTIPTGTSYRYFKVGASSLGNAQLIVSAPGWIPDTQAVRFSTPRLAASGSGSMVAGDPSRGYWYAYSLDSLNYGHYVLAPVVVTATSRNPAAVVVDAPTGTIATDQSSTSVGNALRALPTAGGDSAWIVLTAPGYLPDSFKVYVTAPTLSFQIGYPYDGRVGIGTLFQNAGYVSIPYARPDSFWVVFGHTRRGTIGGPDSVAILPGTTYRYFDVQGDSLGTDTLSITRATGYVVNGGPYVYRVGPLRVDVNSYPGTLYTISPPQLVNAVARDSANFQLRPLLAPMVVGLASRNPAAVALDSPTVTIPAGTYVSNYDTLRVTGVDTIGTYIVASAPGAISDSSGIIRVYPTPLNIGFGYPYALSRGLKLPFNYVTISGGNAPDTIRVALTHTNPLADSLMRDTVLIPRGQSISQYFEIWGLDSTGTDTIIATAPGYVTDRAAITLQASRLDVANLGSSYLTTSPPVRLFTETEPRGTGVRLKPINPVTYTVASTDPNVIRIDSATTVNAAGDTATSVADTSLGYGYTRIQFVGSGTARLMVSAPGFDPDTTNLVTVTGPSLNFGYTNVTVGVGQVFNFQYVYVNNAVTAPLVVALLKSDSLLPADSQAFVVSVDSVVINTGQTSSPSFSITGQNQGAALLVARATGYSQASATISVGQPVLAAGATTLSLYVGERPRALSVSTRDQSGNTRPVAADLVVSAASSDATVAVPDSASRTIAAGGQITTFNMRPLKKGAVDVVFQASGYTSDTTVVSVDTAKLALIGPPNGLGPGQVAQSQMYVDIPYTTDSALVVTLQSSNTGVLTVPPSVTIPANGSYAYFTVTGVAKGVADIIATAPHSLPDTQLVVISQPKLSITFTSVANAGQKYTLTVYARDSLNSIRNVTAPLSVTVASNNPTHTAFDSATITIPAGGSSANTGVTFDTAGTYILTATATGYDPGVDTTTVTGALIRMVGTPSQAFVPQTVTIPVGRVITWRNDDTVDHTTTEDSGTPLWNSGNRTPGQTYSRTFGTVGTFTYHCSIHPSMTGTIVVQ